MPEPTLSQVFGNNATQSASQFVINKADLANVGLTASASNTAESLAVAILLRGASYLKISNQQIDLDIQVTISSEDAQIVAVNGVNYRKINLVINLQTATDTNFVADPDGY